MLFAAALSAQTQHATFAAQSTTQFTDEADGVSFRYPAKWRSGRKYSFHNPVSIASPDDPLRANVFFSSQKGFHPYPHTNLDGAQFAYSIRKAASSEQCLNNVLQADGNAKNLGTENINGISYFHAQTAGGGMCHQSSEDIYATARNGDCYLFDLAVHTLCAGVVDNTREITSSELSQVHASLEKILSSVEIRDLKN